MKKLILILLLSAPLIGMARDFDRGYELGFVEAYKHVKGQLTLPPLAPLPPLPPIDQDTFFGGYNAGFLDGMAKAEE
jgi:hypothetical protein